jgi:hypothetical protein
VGDRPAFASSGSLESAAASQLSAYLDLTPYSGSIGDRARLVIDGNDPRPVSGTLIKCVLDAGRILAVVGPTPGQLRQIAEVAGQGPGGSVAMVALRRIEDGSCEFCISLPATVTDRSGGAESATELPGSATESGQLIARFTGEPAAIQPPTSGLYPQRRLPLDEVVEVARP